MLKFLNSLSVLLKDFREWAQSLTDRVRQATQQVATAAGRPVIYLVSSQIRKEDYIREIAMRDGIEQGLIAVLTCVEPCRTWQVRRNAGTKHLELESMMKKCLFHYFYFLDSRFGLRHVRLQTWLPFNVHICLNGREWLAEDLKRIRMPFEKRDNCFVDVEDVPRAQQLLDQQRHTDWITVLSDLVATVHPTHATLFCQPTELQGRRVRALSPLNDQDGKLLAAISRPGFLLHGSRNQDLPALLFTAEDNLSSQQQ